MASNGPDPPRPKSGGLWSRFFGMGQSKSEAPAKKEEPAATPAAAPAVKEATSSPAPKKPDPATAAAVVDKPATKEPAPMSAEPQASTATAGTPAEAGPQLCPVCQSP